ncbi:MAG: class I SAM-dependent methyltransferase [Cyanobacteria bacterium K_DeepCast_35m_m1_288]|nr:class I SAM-dependent methyltransferase [Cyanobacteria bacterium K_DeepCast_35m_m1_288]
MKIKTTIKYALNRLLASQNIRIDTYTAQRREEQRINRQLELGWFDTPAFPLLDGMNHYSGEVIVQAYAAYRDQLQRLMSGNGDTGFNPDNDYYRSPDAEILYCLVRQLKPKKILEIGSGNSTVIIRQAIVDGGLEVSHTAIDPEPRSDISNLADRVIRERYEEIDSNSEIKGLGANDILFIDSSHEVRVANDVVKLFCNTFPLLAPGVAVHIHDVFLPYDYPGSFCQRFPNWGKQYLVQAYLQSQDKEILWPGYYVQKMRPDLHPVLPFLSKGTAQSFWFYN